MKHMSESQAAAAAVALAPTSPLLEELVALRERAVPAAQEALRRGLLDFDELEDVKGDCGTPACLLGWAMRAGVIQSLRRFLSKNIRRLKRGEEHGDG